MTTQSSLTEPPTPKAIAAGLAYSGLCAVRNTEAHLRWLGAQLGFFLNLPAWAGITFRLIAEPKQLELVVLFIGSWFFAVANAFLYEIIKRDSSLMNLWNDKIAEIERVNRIEGDVQIFTSGEYVRLRNSRQRLQVRLQRIMFAGIAAWIGFAVLTGILYVQTGGVR